MKKKQQRKTRTDKGKTRIGILKSFPGPLPENDLQFIGPDEPVAFEMGGTMRRTTAAKIAEAVANGKRINRSILPDLDPEKVLTDEVKANLKSSFENILNTPSKEPFDLPKYEPPTSYSFELKPTDVFNITVDGRELNMSGQTLKEAFEARIAHDDKKFYTAMDNFADFKRFRVKPEDEVHLVAEPCVLVMKGRDIIDAVAVKDQVENLRQEAEALTNWKNGAVDVLKKWNDVQDYLMKKVDGKTWGRSVAEVALEHLKAYDNLVANQVRQVVNAREYTPEEAVTEFLERLQGHENQYPWILETINSRLIGHLQKIAEQSRETSDIARKRFEESIIILQKLSPQKH